MVVLPAVYLLLMVPGLAPPVPPAGDRQPFVWNRDGYWAELEARFRSARVAEATQTAAAATARLDRCRDLLAQLASGTSPADDPVFDALEEGMFELAPFAAVCPASLPEYARLQADLRAAVKAQSRHWDMGSAAVRDRLYRLLYGSRAALEEALLQAPPDACPALTPGTFGPSQTPQAEVAGVVVHSGDILLSRGGAPASALIARGNDYPGNFSHVALVHVSATTKRVCAIEAHIERGVTVADAAEYLSDPKRRVMVLRPRADLPPLVADPLLPHKAAEYALEQCRGRHITYDFAMDHREHSRLFCSEVAAAAYEEFGVRLWMGMSYLSSPVVRRWLAAFGARHFETQEPADLEYDPQLEVVAEWRAADGLFLDHVDNAVAEAMLARGGSLGYAWWALPAARLAKGYSAVLNLLGKAGPVPEGLDATAALRHARFGRTHARTRARVLADATAWQREHGLRPPYWELARLAEQATAAE